jgi:uncharacterized membrane protein (TIGR02234 family)
MRNRELRLAVALCLLGGLCLLVGVSRAWVVVEQSDGLTIGTVRRTVSGSAVAPGLRALALVALAGVVAVAATRRTGRALVGLLLAVTGIVAVWLAAARLDDRRLYDDASRSAHLCAVQTRSCSAPSGARLDRLRTNEAPVWLALLGGVLVTAGGALTAVRGRRWQGLGSSYEVPGATAHGEPATDKAVWDALDRGDDPTG